MRQMFFTVLLALPVFAVRAETLNLEQAIDRALHSDPRIEERRQFVEVARATLAEVKGHEGWILDANTFLALAPKVEGNIFKDGVCNPGQCQLRNDRYDINNISPWVHLKMTLVKPLNTFGKIENYEDAAQANILVKDQDVRLQRTSTAMDVKRAYYGYLAARDSRLLLEDVARRLDKVIALVEKWLDEGEGDVKQMDLYALQSGRALVAKYRAQAEALEQVALSGLKVVTGVGLDQPLEVSDERLSPVALPATALPELQQLALEQRPEMKQLASGLRARRSLVAASKSEANPNLYAGVSGFLSYTPGRDHLDNPYISDPFNDIGLSPMIGLQWSWTKGVQDAKTQAAEAELNALIAKSSLARQGIPFQVAEQYYQTQGYYQAVQNLEEASRSSRRWMIAAYTDFEAGMEKAEKIMMAFQGYVMASTDYLQTIFEYNMHVAQLESVSGALP
ncbi:MAG: TolC family protein [Gammaproteobacteria bacterium]|nr:TolC family protein [Gammaproteobacteria bacterium]